ncbi:hypothetical protein WICPIJ_004711 [Wickerhamomyces pijperi]|uniref:Phosducin domain-containing protein n=1 Tax=Wickerhamomyces pijperi TaxID=599730 RepID=A0A9P8TMI4_WICPI|nr:hypothetical protein WICPIJ_004711 [Wickerhamomyces pijperi]
MDKFVSKYSHASISRTQGHNDSDVSSEDEDDLLQQLEDELEDSEFNQKYRESRLDQLNKTLNTIKTNVKDNEYGFMTNLLSEDQVFQNTQQNKFTVLMFYIKSFKKCEIMQSKLEILAQKHLTTKFIKINAEDAPFLVTRLKVKVLPCVMLYINGVEANRIVGFDKLNYNEKNDDFTIESLEQFLMNNGVIERKATNYQRVMKKVEQSDDESDLDL